METVGAGSGGRRALRGRTFAEISAAPRRPLALSRRGVTTEGEGLPRPGKTTQPRWGLREKVVGRREPGYLEGTEGNLVISGCEYSQRPVLTITRESLGKRDHVSRIFPTTVEKRENFLVLTSANAFLNANGIYRGINCWQLLIRTAFRGIFCETPFKDPVRDRLLPK